jgi:hypothetical protein
MKSDNPAALRARISELEARNSELEAELARHRLAYRRRSNLVSKLDAQLAAVHAASTGRECVYCRKLFHPHNATALTCSPRCRVALHRAPKGRRAIDKISNAYSAKFGELFGVKIGPSERTLMSKSLRTGRDELAQQRQERAEWEAEYEATRPQREAQEQAEREAYNKANPLTAKEEARYTRLVKRRRLYEGACELRWSDYFAFREAHKCEPLTAIDVEYLSQWTVCPV